MSILAQQMMISEIYSKNEMEAFRGILYNDPNTDIENEASQRKNAFSSESNKYPNNEDYFWSNNSLTVDDNGIEKINSSDLSVNVIG